MKKPPSSPVVDPTLFLLATAAGASVANVYYAQPLLERLALDFALNLRHGRMAAVMLFNIDRFQNVNNARGQAVGDQLLRAVGRDPMAMVSVLAKIHGTEANGLNLLMGSSHPELQERLAKARAAAEAR